MDCEFAMQQKKAVGAEMSTVVAEQVDPGCVIPSASLPLVSFRPIRSRYCLGSGMGGGVLVRWVGLDGVLWRPTHLATPWGRWRSAQSVRPASAQHCDVEVEGRCRQPLSRSGATVRRVWGCRSVR